MGKDRVTLVFLAVVMAVALYFCYLLVAPFLRPILFSAILAIVFYPVHVRLCRSIRSRNIAALLSTTAVILVISLASATLGRAVFSGLKDLYQSLVNPNYGRERLGPYIVHLIERLAGWLNSYFPISVPNLQSAISNQAEKIVSNLLSISAGALGGFTAFLVNTLISCFVLFFFFRDGRDTLRRAAVIIPLRRDQVGRLYAGVKDTLNAILYGTVAIAFIQGTLTGLAFGVLGITSPVLWGVVTSLCALLPVIGTGFVFLPALGMLVVNGHWVKGLILLIWALVIVHPVDNLLRPYLIGGRTKLSTFYVFFAVVGGLKVFGAVGLFIGPLILSITVALFTFLREEQRAGTRSFGLHFVEERETLDRVASTNPDQ